MERETSRGEKPRPRVLIGAYACDPDQGSEPGVGWHWSTQAARFARVHVITRANNRESIERALGGRDNPTFHYLDLPGPILWLKRRTGTYGLVSYYYAWQLAAARLARRLHEGTRFDLVHHVTFANDWLPSGLARLRGVPFLWGPVGGSTHHAPAEVQAGWSPSERRYERARRYIQRALIRFDPFLHSTVRHADLILPYTREAASARHLDGPVRVVTHIGTEARPAVVDRPATGPLRIVTGGRLVHWKGHDLVIQAVARVLAERPGTVELVVTGKGPARSGLEAVARRAGVTRQVEFVGHLPTSADVEQLIAEADLYALPTWRDGPPVAILEAMAVGTAPLCLALGATDELVPDGRGLKVEPFPLETLVDRIADSIAWAVENRGKLAEIGASAQAHTATRHSWDVIGGQIGEIYRRLTRIDG